MPTLRPLHDRVLVQPLDAEGKTSAGIIIPETAKEKPQEGRVLAVGAGKVMDDGKIRPVDVNVGDIILFGKYSGISTKSGNDDLLLLREEDILAVIEER